MHVAEVVRGTRAPRGRSIERQDLLRTFWSNCQPISRSLVGRHPGAAGIGSKRRAVVLDAARRSAARAARSAISARTSGCHRSTGWRAARVSSRRASRVRCGAVRTQLGIARAPPRAIASMRLGEAVEPLEALALGRLDHQRAVHDQREVDRRRVVAVVDQALGDVERRDAVRLELPVREHALVHHRAGRSGTW